MTNGTRRRVSARGAWWSLAAILVAVGLLVGVFASRFGTDTAYHESPLIGAPAPSLTLGYLDGGGTLRTDDLLGGVVVVNFWASWCFPCRTEHEVLVDTASEYSALGVRFVSVLHEDSPESAAAFLDDLGRSDKTDYVVGEGSDAAIDYGIYGIPETFVVDANGIVTERISGMVTTQSLRSAINQALAKTP